MTAARVIGLSCLTAALAFGLHQRLTSLSSEEGEESPSVEQSRADRESADAAAAALSSGADPGSEQRVRESGRQGAVAPAGTVSADAGSREASLTVVETVTSLRLLKEIRDAGFVCYDLLAVESASEDADAWTAYCEAMRYFVSDDGSGRLKVEPMPAVDSGTRPAFGPGSEDTGRSLHLVPSDETGPFPSDN